MAITAKQVLDEAMRGEGALGKAAALDEPVFVLRAQDMHAADLVEKWCIWVSVGDEIDNNKLQEARMIVDQMRQWERRKRPD